MGGGGAGAVLKEKNKGGNCVAALGAGKWWALNWVWSVWPCHYSYIKKRPNKEKLQHLKNWKLSPRWHG